jgi:hypothetical protein
LKGRWKFIVPRIWRSKNWVPSCRAKTKSRFIISKNTY